MKFRHLNEAMFKLIAYVSPPPVPVLVPSTSARNQRRLEAKTNTRRH
jgi:hypothetical protein